MAAERGAEAPANESTNSLQPGSGTKTEEGGGTAEVESVSSSSDQEVAAPPPVLPQSSLASSCPLAASVRQSLPQQPVQVRASCPSKPVTPASSANQPSNFHGVRGPSLQAALSG